MYLEKFIAQLQQAKALLHGFEAHAKGKLAQSEIQRITRLHIDAEIAKLKTSLDQFSARVTSQAGPQ